MLNLYVLIRLEVIGQQSHHIPIPEDLECMTIAVQWANIRNKPTTSSRIIAKLYRGQQVGIIGKQGRWFRVVTPIGKEGWAREDLFEEKTGTREEPGKKAHNK